jgi:hypothetical protein
LTEFEHIFGIGESTFVIWDTDNNGLVDSLELFSGISIFSDTKFDDKVRCTTAINIVLFDIFDFNEVDMLSPVDLEFMLYCCISAAYKVFSINNEIDSGELATFVGNKFANSSKITVADLIK